MINWEIGIDIYWLLYIKQITSKNLLHSTGNSTQYCALTYMGKESKKRVDLCLCITASLYYSFPCGSVVKKSTFNAGSTGTVGLILRSGRFPGGENGNPLQYSCWRSPWTEESGGLQSVGSARVGHNQSDLAHTEQKPTQHRKSTKLQKINF